MNTNTMLTIELDDRAKRLLHLQATRTGKSSENLSKSIIDDYLSGKLSPKDSVDERLESIVHEHLNSFLQKLN